MAAPQQDDEEKPLDPAVEAVRRRLARLLGVSIGVMMIGLLAVLGAIVYKLSGSTSAAPVIASRLVVPQGHVVVDQSLSGDRIMLRLRAPSGDETLVFYDLADGAQIGTMVISNP